MSNVIIIGAGGHAKVVAEIVKANGNMVEGFLDDVASGSLLGLPILGKITDCKKFLDDEFIVAIGDPYKREEVVKKLDGVKWHTAIHPAAVVSGSASIEEGTVVMAGAVVNASAQIGKHCIINTLATVEHDNVISDFVHVSVGAKLGGTVKVGKNTWVGIGATVKNNINICSNCMIGAGAVVVKDIDEAGTYIGVPVRRME